MYSQQIASEKGMVLHDGAPQPSHNEVHPHHLNQYDTTNLSYSGSSDLNKDSSSHLSSTLHAVRKKSIIILHVLLDQFIENCQHTLLEHVNQVQSPQDQKTLIDMNAHLRSNSEAFKQQFLQAINRAFIVPIETEERANSLTTAQSHIQEETWRKKMRSDCELCEKENHVFLNSINTRLGYVIEKTHDKKNTLNPLSPTHLSHVFSTQIAFFDFLLPIVTTRTFSVMDESNRATYNTHNNIENVFSDSFCSSILNKTKGIYYVVDSLLDNKSIPLAKEIDNTLEKEHIALLHHRKNIAIIDASKTRDAWLINDFIKNRKVKSLSQHELLNILNIIQTEHCDSFEIDIKKLFFQTLNEQKRFLGYTGNITQQDTQRIELVINLFNIASLNPNLHKTIKRYINRLITPLVKVAILDPRFLSSSDHIARNLLNKAVLHSLTGQKVNNQSIRTLEFIDAFTLKIVNEFHIDLDTLKDAYSLLQSRELESELFHHNQTKACLNIQHFDSSNDDPNDESSYTNQVNNTRQQEAEQNAQAAIEGHLAQNAHHEYIQHFATTLWQQVLARTALKHGIDSEVWDRHIKILCNACKLSLPTKSDESSRQQRQDITLILNAIQQALVDCAHNPMQGSDAVETLCTLFKEAYRGNKPSMDGLGHATPSSVIVDTRLKGKMTNEIDPHAQYHQELIKQVRQFSRGAWFDWKSSSIRIIRCRLAAIIKDPERYIFTDREGAKVAELLLDDAAHALYEQKLAPIQGHGVFDQALETIVTNLRERHQDKNCGA